VDFTINKAIRNAALREKLGKFYILLFAGLLATIQQELREFSDRPFIFVGFRVPSG
jgi:hypothetical protein